MKDIVIIGAGVVGSAVARELSRYKASILVLEKGNDVSVGASKANSGIVHAGFDAHPGTLKAKYNVLGAAMFEKMSRELDFPYVKNGAMVLNFDESKTDALEELLRQGEENGVKELKIISGDEARAIEPEISESVVNALLVPTSGIVSPYEMAIAYAENANVNGVEFEFNRLVTTVEKTENGFIIKCEGGYEVEAKAVINCAGVNSDDVNNGLSEQKYDVVARKGEYCLLDKSYGYITSTTLFQLPTNMGKGVLVAPTCHGNILVGPTAIDTLDKGDVDTTPKGLQDAWNQAQLSVKNLPRRGIITQFAGLRAHNTLGDFVIGESDVKGFYNCLGVESPGLSSAPAIGVDMAQLVAKNMNLELNPNFIAKREGILHFSKLSNEDRIKAIKKNPLYGKVVCRCEVVTEGEIVDAIHRPLGAKDLDGVKRRTRAGMGRCQSGFCSPTVIAILCRELGLTPEEVTKSGKGSEFILSEEE